jgi:signal transduction histidine kinase
MSLKAKFFLLVAGIVIVPFLVTAAAISFHIARNARSEPVLNYFEILGWMRDEAIPKLKNGEQDVVLDTRPQGLDLAIFDPDNTVFLSTIEPFQQGEKSEYKDIIAYMTQEGRDFEVQVQTLNIGGKDFILLSQYAKNLNKKVLKIRSLQAVFYFSFTLFVFAFLFSFYLARSINNSIRRLEQATRRIAEGDLDFELNTEGKDEFASLTKSFDSMRSSLKEEIAQRARFIMGVSHDLKTPLALIEGYVEAISDGYARDPATLKKYTDIIQEKAKNLSGLITDLMNFARMETGEWKMTLKEINLKNFLEKTGKIFTEDASLLKRDFFYRLDIPEDKAVFMDERLIMRVMENIIGNAFRYTEEGGKVSLEAVTEGEKIVIMIHDTGIGIKPEDQKMIFNPFYRATNSRREHGTGMGLYTAKSILDSHGFKIWFESKPGIGTTMFIMI